MFDIFTQVFPLLVLVSFFVLGPFYRPGARALIVGPILNRFNIVMHIPRRMYQEYSAYIVIARQGAIVAKIH